VHYRRRERGGQSKKGFRQRAIPALGPRQGKKAGNLWVDFGKLTGRTGDPFCGEILEEWLKKKIK